MIMVYSYPRLNMQLEDKDILMADSIYNELYNVKEKAYTVKIVKDMENRRDRKDSSGQEKQKSQQIQQRKQAYQIS